MDTLWMVPVSVFASLGTSVVAGWLGIRHLAGLRLAAEDSPPDSPADDEFPDPPDSPADDESPDPRRP